MKKQKKEQMKLQKPNSFFIYNLKSEKDKVILLYPFFMSNKILKHMKSKLLIATALTLYFQFFTFKSSAQNLTQVSNFGSNPGSLNMYKYMPTGVNGTVPLVVALHGCTQNASQYAQQTGWNKLANLHKFYVIYPEQIAANNSTYCFNWFDTTDVNKDLGEVLSIKQMVDYMIANYSINPSAIFVTGVSAGAGMSVALLADYPQIFNKGAIIAGLPYKAATSSLNAYTAMNGGVIKTPAQWSTLVKSQNPGYNGPFPHIAIFHGTADYTVNNGNAIELIKQWTELNNADQTADYTNNSFDGNSIIQQTIYNDNLNNPVVIYYKVTGMGHAVAIDTGACPRQGGVIATYALEEHFHSTYWAADFFDILTGPYSITGAVQVIPSATNIAYSVPFTSGSTYTWTVPMGAIVASGQGSNSITTNFGNNNGYIKVAETTSGNCKNDTAKLYVDVISTANINTLTLNPISLVYNKADNSLEINNCDLTVLNSFIIYNTLGQKINQTYSIRGNKIVFSSDFKTGIYFVNMIIAQSQKVFKVIIY